MFPELTVPLFRRLSDYAGAWAIEPTAFAALWHAISRMDLTAHMAEAQAPLTPLAEMVSTRSGRSVAMIPVTGPLMKQRSSMGGTSTIQLRKEIRQAAADPNVSGILLAIESPGGSVSGTDDLAADVRQAAKSKPVFAHVDDLAASAAYWIASQADAIYANSNTALVGSIGTIITLYDQSAAAEASGVKAMVFATGPLKGAGVPGTKITEDQAAYFQGIVNAAQVEFDRAVRQGRGLTASQLADAKSGGVFAAPEAKSRGLIDGVQSLSKTLDALVAAADERGTKKPRAALPMLGSRGLPMLQTTSPSGDRS